MCGIVGANTPNADSDVEKMLGKIAYRGPDDRGKAIKGRWTIGHSRLAIIDLDGGGQPMKDPESGAEIALNGEIYNFMDIRCKSEANFHTRSDAEVVLKLHASADEPEIWLNELDGMYALAIVDDNGLLLARDPLGVKPLYVGKRDDTLVFGSEMKAVLEVTDRILEFPPGYVYTTGKGARPFKRLAPDWPTETDFEAQVDEVRRRVIDGVTSRLIADVPVGVFLSGGLDSSIVAAIASTVTPNLKTFSVGMKGSPDLAAARKVSEFLGTDHYERIVTEEEAIQSIQRVIFHLESFDVSLVRSAVANYFLAELASQHVKVALSGEGADELFAGYAYLRTMHGSRLEDELREITEELHNTNLQRCDRMSMAHGLEVRVPFVDDLRIVQYAMGIPVQYKIDPRSSTDKLILRKAFEDFLPEEIVNRRKVKFSAGSGMSDALTKWADGKFDDATYSRAQTQFKKFEIRSKEELAYFLIFRSMFPAGRLLPLIGRSRSV